ncbi:MAG TPA: malonate decarboxylase subunit epsilon [Puia sp.]|nr:malonate decarboxylase subunit epsilon [Puia sp.]
MKTVFLFPGQGSQKPGMLNSVASTDTRETGEDIVSAVYADVKEILGQDPQILNSEESLRSTVYAQICLLISGVISARKLQARGVRPDFVAGHSVGAFAAAVVSGVLSFKNALSLVHTRGLLMEQAYPNGYGMAALTGISESALRSVLNLFNRTHDTIYLSNVNAADQQVVAGRLTDLLELMREMETKGIRKALLLNVAVPSHCPLLNQVADTLKAQLERLVLNEPSIPYASNHNGRILKTRDAIKEDLYKSIATTVRWYDATSLIYELGGRIFIEMEPSGVLARIATSTFPEAKVLAAEDQDTTVWLWNSFQQ